MAHWLRSVASGLAVAFGLGRDAPRSPAPARLDEATALAHERTGMAAQRTYFAVERTLMGWIRTALAMISFGFTIGKIGRALARSDSESRDPWRIDAGDFDSVAYFLLILGTLSLLAASLQYSLRVQALHAQGLPRQVSIALPVALVLVVIGAVAFAVLAR